MDEVHGVADVVVHALEGHVQVSVFEACQDAGRERARMSFQPEDLDWTCRSQRGDHSLFVSVASGEEVHEAAVDVRLCSKSRHRRLKFVDFCAEKRR